MAFARKPEVLEPMWSTQPERLPRRSTPTTPSDDHPATIRSEVDGTQIGIATNPEQLRQYSAERFDYDNNRRL